MEYGGIRGLTDVRDRLQRNPEGGPGCWVALGEKRGVVVHYSGPPVDLERDDLELIQSEAVYHCMREWGWDAQGAPLYGDGLMYHLAIGRDGRKLLCRAFEAVLWHCGAWPYNTTALAVHVPIGGEQRASSAQIEALVDVCEQWLDGGHGTRREIWGRQELSATSCPGTLMADFV